MIIDICHLVYALSFGNKCRSCLKNENENIYTHLVDKF